MLTGDTQRDEAVQNGTFGLTDREKLLKEWKEYQQTLNSDNPYAQEGYDPYDSLTWWQRFTSNIGFGSADVQAYNNAKLAAKDANNQLLSEQISQQRAAGYNPDLSSSIPTNGSATPGSELVNDTSDEMLTAFGAVGSAASALMTGSVGMATAIQQLGINSQQANVSLLEGISSVVPKFANLLADNDSSDNSDYIPVGDKFEDVLHSAGINMSTNTMRAIKRTLNAYDLSAARFVQKRSLDRDLSNIIEEETRNNYNQSRRIYDTSLLDKEYDYKNRKLNNDLTQLGIDSVKQSFDPYNQNGSAYLTTDVIAEMTRIIPLVEMYKLQSAEQKHLSDIQRFSSDKWQANIDNRVNYNLSQDSDYVNNVINTKRYNQDSQLYDVWNKSYAGRKLHAEIQRLYSRKDLVGTIALANLAQHGGKDIIKMMCDVLGTGADYVDAFRVKKPTQKNKNNGKTYKKK